MVHLKLILTGVTVLASIGFAIYSYYNSREENQQYQYQYRNGPDSPTRERPPPMINSSERPRRRRRKPSTLETCTICLEIVEASSKNSSSLSCGHLFHYVCIKKWVYHSDGKKCPVCRQVIGINEGLFF